MWEIIKKWFFGKQIVWQNWGNLTEDEKDQVIENGCEIPLFTHKIRGIRAKFLKGSLSSETDTGYGVVGPARRALVLGRCDKGFVDTPAGQRSYLTVSDKRALKRKYIQ